MDTQQENPVFGLMAEFETPEQLVAAATLARDAGYKKMDAYTPFAVEGMGEALGFRDERLPFIMLAGGVLGGLSGFGLADWCMSSALQLNIGGRPLHSYPSWIPVTFELTVLFSALIGVGAMIVLNGLPMPYHPTFNVPEFARASTDRFFLCIESDDQNYDPRKTLEFMRSLGSLSISEVPS